MGFSGVFSEKVSRLHFAQMLKDPCLFIQQTFTEHLLCARLCARWQVHLLPGSGCLRWEGSEGPSAAGPSPCLPRSPTQPLPASCEHSPTVLDH